MTRINAGLCRVPNKPCNVESRMNTGSQQGRHSFPGFRRVRETNNFRALEVFFTHT